MTDITVDRTLKELLIGLMSAMGHDFPSFKVAIVKYYSDRNDEKTGREYIKKLKSPNITWKTYLQTLKSLGLGDEDDVQIGLEHNLPISPTTWSDSKTVWYKLTNFEHTVNDLAATELSRFLSQILKESKVPQNIYLNRIIEWIMGEYPELNTNTVRIKASGFVKKVSGDNITWTTFTAALKALGINQGIFRVKITLKNGTVNKYKLKIIGE